MKKLAVMALVVYVFSCPVFANNNADIMVELEKAAQKYCDFYNEPEQMILINGKTFVVYTTAGEKVDGECSSGSGTIFQHIAEMSGSKVINPDILDSLSGINTRFITDIHISSDGILTFKNNEYSEDDPSCCPNDLFLNKVRLFDMKVLSRKLLGRVPSDEHQYGK